MSHAVDIAQPYKTRGIITFPLVASGLGVSAWMSSLACSLINIVGDCPRCGGGRVAERWAPW